MFTALHYHRFVISILLLLPFYESKSQSWRPEFRVRLDYGSIYDKEARLNKFLYFNAEVFEKSCKAQMAIFYFRVNHVGIVDSLYSEGNFDEREREVINKNILDTNKSWILPHNTKKTDKCWFIFPCFIFGSTNHCDSPEQKNQVQLVSLRNLLSKFAGQEDSQGRYLLPPNPERHLIIR